MEEGNITEETIVRERFSREEDFDNYGLGTTSPIKATWPITTPTSHPRTSPNTSSPSAATRRKPTPREGKYAFLLVLHARFREE